MASTPSNYGRLMNGWFSEVNDQWPGQAMSLECDKVLLDEKSAYQHVQVYSTRTWGHMLVLDGVIQLTERDEMSYQEMIAHLPLYSHPNPEHVLIIGGGDGGVIRECVKHSSVKSITICEIDQLVIDAGKKYFPSVAAAWDDPRVTLFCGDGAEFMRRAENVGKYDVIISDTSDPVGPAQALFESPFYRAMHDALKAGGKVCTQAESMWINLDLIGKLVREALEIYANAEYATTQTPTYPAGQIGFLLCSKAGGKGKSCATPARRIPRGEKDKYKYYTSELHAAAFVLPAFVERKVAEAREAAEQKKKEEAKEKKGKRASGKMETAATAAAVEESKEDEGNNKKLKTDAE